MGYSYTLSGQLCCDGCDNAGGVRRVRCPFNYCQPAALCPDCRAREPKGAARKRQHAECERLSTLFHARARRETELLAAGFAVRCSALAVDRPEGPRVHVLFRKADGSCLGFYMTRAAYDSRPLFEPSIPGDYDIPGACLDVAPPDFYSPAGHQGG
jgi:hypothetical protein